MRRSLGDPHLVLAAAAAVAVGAEVAYRRHAADGWLVLEAAAVLLALIYAWRRQDSLRLGPLLAAALLLFVGMIAVHLAYDYRGDIDARGVYRRQGEALLHGDYPRSEYPVGAVLLFALEAALSGGATRVANAFAMVPFQLLALGSIYRLRSRFAPWLAAAVALWPLDAFFWEFKFDLAPAALLALGLGLALREHWAAAGIALAIGTLVKWTPALAFVALLAWLLARRETRTAARHALAFTGTVVLVYLPFLLWQPSDVLAAYTKQGGRPITAESVWFLPLHAAGLAHVRGHISYGAGAPRWAEVVAVAVQIAAVLALVVAAAAARRNLASGVALAALVPVAFLLTNRIFSPQFLVPALVGWAIAAALVVRSRTEQLGIALVLLAAAAANAFVYPFALPDYDVLWEVSSGALFALGSGATAWLAARAVRAARSHGYDRAPA